MASNQDRSSKTYPAWQLYDGLMYRYMDRRGIGSKEENYLRDHVRVATALYGLIHPFEFISPHRLDFQGSLKIGNQSLKQYWRPYYDQEVGDDELILSLASSEFEQVFSPQIQKRLVKFFSWKKSRSAKSSLDYIKKVEEDCCPGWLRTIFRNYRTFKILRWMALNIVLPNQRPTN